MYAPYCQYYDVIGILYKDYIKQAQDNNVDLNISGFVTRASESSGEGTFPGNIKHKFYKTEIYKKLSRK